MEILKPNELREKFQDPWIAPYEKVLTMVDGDKVELVEYHPCISGSHWLLHQYRNNSELIDSAYRDGNKHVYKCHVGSAPLDLKASFNAAGIDEIAIDGDEVKVTHAGLAGAGVGAGMCRGMGEGVKYIELLDVGGGSKVGRATVVTPKLEKVVIGVDDTDVKDAGATWTMAHNLGVELRDLGFEYLDHIIVQLYPHNPHKTQNCVSIALTFAVEESKKQELIDKTIEILKRDTLSDKTAIAILEGLDIPEKLREYSIATKSGMMDIETEESVADELNIPLIAVTGEQGKVGALAALGLMMMLKKLLKLMIKKNNLN
jgi:methanogenesis imperfect marker protein 11